MTPQLAAQPAVTSSSQPSSLIDSSPTSTPRADSSSQRPTAQVEATPLPPTEVECAGSTPLPADEASIKPVVEVVNTDKANFGGAYLDSDGVFVIEYVGANAGRPAVEAVLDPRVCVRWQKVDRSGAQLDQIMTAIMDRNLNGVGAIAIDTVDNQVEVDVYPPEDVAQLSQLLSGEYAAAVNVVGSSAAPSF